MVNETLDQNPIIMESLNFANIVTREFNKNKPSVIIPILKVAADRFGLDIKYELEYKAAKRYVVKCINSN